MTHFIIGLYEENIVLYRSNHLGLTKITTVPETMWTVLKSIPTALVRVYWLGDIKLFQSLETTFFKRLFWRWHIPVCGSAKKGAGSLFACE